MSSPTRALTKAAWIPAGTTRSLRCAAPLSPTHVTHRIVATVQYNVPATRIEDRRRAETSPSSDTCVMYADRLRMPGLNVVLVTYDRRGLRREFGRRESGILGKEGGVLGARYVEGTLFAGRR